MPSLVILDVDGVLTDGRINIGHSGELYKSFDVKDGSAVARWIRDGGEIVVVTGRESSIVEERARELGIHDVFQSESDKLARIEAIVDDREFDLDDVVFVGDDDGDVEAMKAVGLGVAPRDASGPARRAADVVLERDGGDGAVHELLKKLSTDSWRVLGVIPARYASKRLPGKPLVDVAGKPMVQRVYERASMASELDDLVVATDDERIADAIESFGGAAEMTSSHHESGTERVAEVASRWDHELIVNIQGDEPLIDPDVIDRAVEGVKQSHARMCTPVSPIEEPNHLDDENVVKVVMDGRGRALYFSRSRIPSRASVEETYRHVGLYVFERELLKDFVEMDSRLEDQEDLEQLRLLENGYEISTVEVDYRGKEINVENDIPEVERLLEGASEP